MLLVATANRRRVMSKRISPEALVLRKLREIKGVSRQEASILLGITFKTVEKMENGRTIVNENLISRYLSAYGFSRVEFSQCLNGETHLVAAKYHKPALSIIKKIRRFNQRNITKEVKAIISLRKMKGIDQVKASILCGYRYQLISHIENGRVDLTQGRLSHMIQSYGFTMAEYERIKSSDFIYSDIQSECLNLIKVLNPEALASLHSFLKIIKK